VGNPETWLRTLAFNQLRGGWLHAAVVRRYQVRVPRPQLPVEDGPEHVAIVTTLGEVPVTQVRQDPAHEVKLIDFETTLLLRSRS
jgi:hypothetical protein